MKQSYKSLEGQSLIKFNITMLLHSFSIFKQLLLHFRRLKLRRIIIRHTISAKNFHIYQEKQQRNSRYYG